MSETCAIGIDLGTSNSAIALTDLESGATRIVEATQILGPNKIGETPTLPSALYLPHEAEFPPGAFPLPWDDAGEALIGHFARDHGALVPDRLATSAKSWLSNRHIDPKQPVLPWDSESVTEKLSPFDCSRRYLEHLRQGFFHAEKSLHGREWDLAEARIVLTVPASFDEVARALTAEAAEAAGLVGATLLEEPQAAFYAWTEAVGSAWREQIAPGDVVLVCDVGGGTADFSLIAVAEQAGELALERISVGEHILLGGDNMDLTLAYLLQAGLEAEGKSIDAWRFRALIHAASKAKQLLFEDATLEKAPIALPSRGSSLFAKTISLELSRAVMEQVILDGFFPITEIDEQPDESAVSGLQEFGLPFAADPVVSKHLARFLTRSLANVAASPALSALVGDKAAANAQFLAPTAVLFNGGVFKAEPIRTRVLKLLAHWSRGQPVRELAGFQPDLAVAKGAAFYGRTRATGQGMRIKAGAARSYYIGLQSSMPAVPGFKPPVKALCVVPQGMEEGSEHLIEGQTFGLVVGKPAEFRFFSSEVRSGDQPGQILPNAEKELQESNRLRISLPPMEDLPEGQAVPVRIDAAVTEMGVLELWMKHANSERKWKVEFQVRTE